MARSEKENNFMMNIINQLKKRITEVMFLLLNKSFSHTAEMA